jgi:hypothetical protein
LDKQVSKDKWKHRAKTGAKLAAAVLAVYAVHKLVAGSHAEKKAKIGRSKIKSLFGSGIKKRAPGPTNFRAHWGPNDSGRLMPVMGAGGIAIPGYRIRR